MTSLHEFIGTKEAVRSKPFIAEQELLIAVLDRAVLDYHGAKSGLRESAGEWLFGDSDYSHAFSFCRICEHLNICPARIRDRIDHLELPMQNAQGHRWLRRKVQSSDRVLPRLISDKEAA